MVLMHDAPFAIDFPESHREPEFKRLPPARPVSVDASSFCGGKGNVRSRCNLNIFKTERHRLLNT